MILKKLKKFLCFPLHGKNEKQSKESLFELELIENLLQIAVIYQQDDI